MAGYGLDLKSGPTLADIRPIAPAPGAHRQLQLSGQEVTIDGGALRLSSRATKALLNDMLCLPARLSTVLTIELVMGGAPAGGAPAAKLSTLRVHYPPGELDGSFPLDDVLHSCLKLGKRRGIWLAHEGADALSSFDVEYLYWRRCGGGPDGEDPVYALRLSSSSGPFAAALTPGELRSPGDGALDAALEPYGSLEEGAVTGSSPEEAAAEFLGTLEMVVPPARAIGGKVSGASGRRGRSRSRSRSRERRRESSRERPRREHDSSFRHRERSRSNTLRRRERSSSPRRTSRGRSPVAPGLASRLPPPTKDLCMPGAGPDWAVGTLCEDPIAVRRLTPLPPGIDTTFYTDIEDKFGKGSYYVGFARKMHGALFGLTRSAPLPTHLVRAVMVIKDADGRVETTVPMCFERNRLLQWGRLLGALRDGVKLGDYIVFELMGTFRLEQPGFRDHRVPFFEVQNRGSSRPIMRPPLVEKNRGTPLPTVR